MKNKFKKGFTLVELIVVLAIFSILMAAVMSMIDPVSQIFKRTAVSEKTYAYANNIQTYLQTNLEYAESVVVATSDKIGGDDNIVTIDELNRQVEIYRQNHFENTVMTENGTDICWLNGRIHVLRLVNDKSDPNCGQIMHRVYDFASNEKIDGIADPVEQTALNDAFFKARDSKYNFNYALGSGKLVGVDTPSSGDANSTYKAFEPDVKGTPLSVAPYEFVLSIVIDQAGKNNQGSIDETSVTVDADGNPVSSNTYRAFRMPAVLQEVPITFTNINFISGSEGGSAAPARPYKPQDPVTGDYGAVQMQPEIDESYRGLAFATVECVPGNSKLNNGSIIYDTIDFNSDIYFIYALSDEMTAGDPVD